MAEIHLQLRPGPLLGVFRRFIAVCVTSGKIYPLFFFLVTTVAEAKSYGKSYILQLDSVPETRGPFFHQLMQQLI